MEIPIVWFRMTSKAECGKSLELLRSRDVQYLDPRAGRNTAFRVILYDAHEVDLLAWCSSCFTNRADGQVHFGLFIPTREDLPRHPRFCLHISVPPPADIRVGLEALRDMLCPNNE